MFKYESINDIEWEQLAHLFPEPAKRGRGKPHTPWRTVVNAIFFVLLGRQKWHMIPLSPEFATRSVAHRWFSIWEKSGFLETLYKAHQTATGRTMQMTPPPRRQRSPKAKEPSLVLELDIDASLLVEPMATWAQPEFERVKPTGV